MILRVRKLLTYSGDTHDGEQQGLCLGLFERQHVCQDASMGRFMSSLMFTILLIDVYLCRNRSEGRAVVHVALSYWLACAGCSFHTSNRRPHHQVGCC